MAHRANLPYVDEFPGWRPAWHTTEYAPLRGKGLMGSPYGKRIAYEEPQQSPLAKGTHAESLNFARLLLLFLS